MKAFFKLQDHRFDGNQGNSVRLSEVVAVGMPQQHRHGAANVWYVSVALRDSVVYHIGGDIAHCHAERDKLLHALEQDAERSPVHPLGRPDT